MPGCARRGQRPCTVSGKRGIFQGVGGTIKKKRSPTTSSKKHKKRKRAKIWSRGGVPPFNVKDDSTTKRRGVINCTSLIIRTKALGGKSSLPIDDSPSRFRATREASSLERKSLTKGRDEGGKLSVDHPKYTGSCWFIWKTYARAETIQHGPRVVPGLDVSRWGCFYGRGREKGRPSADQKGVWLTQAKKRTPCLLP